MDKRAYTLNIKHKGESILTRSGDNLSRLTACLLSMIEYDFNDAIGEITENESGVIIRRCKRSTTA